MSKSNVVEFAGRDGIDDPLRELLRTGAGELVYQAVQRSCRSCWRSTHNGVYRMAEQAWCATAICRRARFRRDWVR